MPAVPLDPTALHVTSDDARRHVERRTGRPYSHARWTNDRKGADGCDFVDLTTRVIYPLRSLEAFVERLMVDIRAEEARRAAGRAAAPVTFRVAVDGHVVTLPKPAQRKRPLRAPRSSRSEWIAASG